MNYCYPKNTPRFTIKSYKGKQWKKWDTENKKMLSSETYQQGYRKMHSFILDNGDILELSNDQTGQMLVGCLEAGKALAGMTFEAKSNGKTGLDTRWFINVARKEYPENPTGQPVPKKDEISEPPF